MRSMIMIQKPTIQLCLTLCLPPWRDPISVWNCRVPTSAAGPCMMRKSSMAALSSHAPFSLQIAEYDECIAVLLLSFWGLFENCFFSVKKHFNVHDHCNIWNLKTVFYFNFFKQIMQCKSVTNNR